MIVASIDIGTNTVLLLIAKIDIKSGVITTIRNEYKMPRIGQGVKASGIIKDDRIKLLFGVLSEYNKIIKQYDCKKVILTGTNAFRIASNSDLIINQIKKNFGYRLKIISGEEEAEYAYLGAISGMECTRTTMVIDIGGSSTELILGMGKKITSKKSLQLGSVSLTEQFLHNSPPIQSELENLKYEIKKLVSTVTTKQKPETVIAIAGTATTLACMLRKYKEFNQEIVENSNIEYQELKNLTIVIEKLKSNKMLEIYGPILNGREDIILAGSYVLLTVMEIFQIERLKVSSRGIRYGAIIKYLNI